MTTPTAEEFLAQRDPDEEDDDVVPLPAASDPLTSIAASLGLLTEIVVRRDGEEKVEDESKQAVDQQAGEQHPLAARGAHRGTGPSAGLERSRDGSPAAGT